MWSQVGFSTNDSILGLLSPFSTSFIFQYWNESTWSSLPTTGRVQKGRPVGQDWGWLSPFWVSVTGPRCCRANTPDGH